MSDGGIFGPFGWAVNGLIGLGFPVGGLVLVVRMLTRGSMAESGQEPTQ